jgi:succinate-acetate transporter protein
MATLHVSGDVQPVHPNEAEPAEPVSGFMLGNPAMLALPTFIVGSVALGLVFVGMVPATAVGASLPIILAATGLGQFVSTLWAAGLGETAIAGVFGVFTGFWLSYAVLVLGLTHGWFGIAPTAIAHTEELFLTSWLVVIVMITLATLRLPLAFTVLFVLVDIALLLVLIGTVQASTSPSKIAGYVAFAFCAVGAYLFFGVASVATGGQPLPLGRPILHK